MTRFVVVASLRRGAIEPAEVLDDMNQERAAARWERDEEGLGEIVSWRDGQPYVGKLPGSERMPRISPHLRASLRGHPMMLDDDSALERRRRGIRGRV